MIHTKRANTPALAISAIFLLTSYSDGAFAGGGAGLVKGSKGPSLLPARSELGYITGFTTKNDDSMVVHHTPGLVSAGDVVHTTPDSGLPCSGLHTDTHTDYITDPSNPSHKLQHAALIGAYLHHKQTQIFVDGCINGIPRIMSVDVKD